MIAPVVKSILFRVTLWGILLGFIVFRPCGVEAAGETGQEEILSVGFAAVSEGNLALAKSKAIEAALTKGVERDVARRLGRQGMINSFADIVHTILPAAKEAVENYHILAEDQAGGRYTVLVRLKVNDKVMTEKLRLLGAANVEGPPMKVLFLVSHIEPENEHLLYWWSDPDGEQPLTPTELALYRAFEEKGFTPINRMINVPGTEFTEEMRESDLSFEEASRWGQAFSAKVVITGRCTVFGNGSVAVSLSALDPATATVLGREDREESKDTGDSPDADVLSRAINSAVERLSPVIYRSVHSTDHALNRLEISLEGLTSFRQFTGFKDFLEKEIKGVESVVQTRIKGKTLTVMVEFSGEEARFLELVTGHERLPFPIDVATSEAGEIIFRIK